MNVNFSTPDITELEIEEVTEALRSGWITTGMRTKKLERELAEYMGTKRCVCLNSQTACQEMALRLLGVGPGDEVITCAYTYTASASVIEHVGARIVLIDTQKGSLEMDYDALERAVNENTKAIIPIDLAGIPCNYDRIFEIVENKKTLFTPRTKIQSTIGRVAILADAAHALGAEWHGKKVGNIADFTSFSFHAVKNFTTGEGGALTWRHIEGFEDDELYKQLQLFSLHGQSKDALTKTLKGSWEYDVVGTWYKCNMTDIAAAIGLAQLKRYPDMLIRRRQIIEKYNEAFKDTGIEFLPHYTDDYASSGHLYITRVPGIASEQRNEIIVKMSEQGISCNVHYKPLPLHTAYKNMGFDMKDFPNAYARFANAVTLPLSTKLTDEEVDYVIENYKKIVSCYIK